MFGGLGLGRGGSSPCPRPDLGVNPPPFLLSPPPPSSFVLCIKIYSTRSVDGVRCLSPSPSIPHPQPHLPTFLSHPLHLAAQLGPPSLASPKVRRELIVCIFTALIVPRLRSGRAALFRTRPPPPPFSSPRTGPHHIHSCTLGSSALRLLACFAYRSRPLLLCSPHNLCPLCAVLISA